MLKIIILLALAGLQLCHGRERRPVPDPPEIARYQALKVKRLVYEKLKESKLITVPGYIGLEAEDDNEPPFVPSLECGDEFLNLTRGSFGTITSPNYPRKYLPDLQCEWVLEGVPGTVIEITLFDSKTQPWLFTFYDYIKISLDGNWDKFYRFAGDVNYKTPFSLVSQDNKLVIRFITSSFLNFRGFSLSYVVRNKQKSDVNPQTNEFGSIVNNNIVAVCNRRPDTPQRPNDKVTQDRETVKIINGEVAVAHKYPFTVALVIDGQYFCAGTLIDDVNVVTSAHCVDGAERIVLIFGLHNMTNPAERYYSRQYRLVEFPDTANHVLVHPHYDPDTAANDIAIVRVRDKVKFTGYVQPIYLPSVYGVSNVFYRKALKTVGWGQYDFEVDGISPVLREGRSEVISNGDCREEFRGAITGNNICTLTPYAPAEAANGTSTTTVAPPTEPAHKIVRKSNVTNENPDEEEGAAEIEPQPQPGFVSPCFADSGGPLFTEFVETLDGPVNGSRHDCVEAKPNGSNDGDKKIEPVCDSPIKELPRKWYVFVGIVSFGAQVCGDPIPVAYTRVAGHLEWIAYVTGRHG